MNRNNDHEQSSGLLSLGLGSHKQTKLEKKANGSKMHQQNQDDMGFKCTWAFWMFVLFVIFVSLIVSRYYFPPSSNLKLDNQQLAEISTLKSIYQHFTVGSQQKQTTKNENASFQQQNSINSLKDQPTQAYEPFSSPHKLFLFVNSNSIHKDYIHNIEHYTSPSKSSIQLVTMQNYPNLIRSPQVVKILEKVKTMQTSQQEKQKFVQHLVVFCLLEQNGGVSVGGNLIMTQELDKSLIKKIQENKNDYRIFLYLDQKNQSTIDFDLQNYFIATGKHFKLLTLLIQKMTKALQMQIFSSFPSPQNLLKRYNEQFNQLFRLKFKQYSSSKQGKDGKTFLEFLQIYSLGSIKSLQTLQSQFLDISNPNHLQYLYSYEEQSLEELVGPFNPVVRLPLKSYASFLNQIKNSQNHPIISDSFLYRHMISFSSTYSTIKPLIPETDSEKYSHWQVPKILWTFVNKLDQKSSLHDYFIANLMANSKESGFELMVLTQETIQVVLDEKEIHDIFSNFKNLQTEYNHISNQRILSQLAKLYVLKKYGGVFVDFSYFLLENLNWIPRIKSNQHIFNNIEKDPEVFMFHKNSVQEWSVNLNSGIKTAHNLKYLAGFIAAIKNSKLVTNWLDIFIKNIKGPQRSDKIDQKHCNLDNVQRQNLAEASLQCIFEIQKENGQPKTEQKNEYKIWSINGLLGGQKMNFVMKAQQNQCFDFKDSLSQFKSSYGSLGYVSELITDVDRKQLDENLSYFDDDSIFKQFFANKNVDRKKIVEVKSLKYVSEGVQKIKK